MLLKTSLTNPSSGQKSHRVFEVNLLGTANVIQAFLPHAAQGTSVICISSLAGHWVRLSKEFEQHLATAPLDQLLQHADLALPDPADLRSYAIAKRGNQLRVQSTTSDWGLKGARINTISPGLISTPILSVGSETGKPHPQLMEMIDQAPMKRIGTPEDIATLVEFLIGPGASFITGSDILIDGGAKSSRTWSDMGSPDIFTKQ
jgi:NAD(P)-dependent dehydrogenase (short-subunit alcohol dehydrogenase family)